METVDDSTERGLLMHVLKVSRPIAAAGVCLLALTVAALAQRHDQQEEERWGRPPSPDCVLLVALHQNMSKEEYKNYVRAKTLEGWTRERGVTAGMGHFGRIWLCPPPPDQPASVQTLPILPFSFGLGLGHRAHGDDQFQK